MERYAGFSRHALQSRLEPEPGIKDLNRDYEVTIVAYYPQYDSEQEKVEKVKADTVEQAIEAVRKKWIKEGAPYHVMSITGKWALPENKRNREEKR